MPGGDDDRDRDLDRDLDLDPKHDDEKRAMLAVPIPSYDEATSSRAASEYGDDAGGDDGEATRLLQRPTGGYRPPTVESARASVDSSFLDEFASARSSSVASVQRQMVELDDLDAESGAARRPTRRLRASLTKRFGSLSSSLSALSLPPNPFRGWAWRARWRAWRALGWLRVPELPQLPNVPCCSATLVPVYRLVAVLMALIVVYAVLASDAFSFGGPVVVLGPENVREFAQAGPKRENMLQYLKYLTSFDHMAGTEGDFVLARWVKAKFASFGLDAVDESQYYVYLNYPIAGGRSVSIEDPPWDAKLEEPVVDGTHENTLVFHGHSKSGTAEGPAIYANYGAREDFDTLAAQGVDVKGAIVLVRYGGTEGDRALKVKAAEDRGAAGVLIFSDPKTEGWDWPGNAVQRGAVSLMSFVAGDVLTIGYPATEDADRMAVDETPGLVKIPSLPLSPDDAAHILRSIKGRGRKLSDDAWTGSVHGVDEWWTGSLDSSPRVTLKNEQHEEIKQPIWNIHGHIRGTDDQHHIIVGNHRDAWCFGAGDPNSGTAIMLEVARVLGEMMELSYRPLRSISFMSWDAEEYNLIGSTEWVEDNIAELRARGMTYINLDSAVTGTTFTAQGSPLLQSVFKRVLSRVNLPDTTNTSILEHWGADRDLPGLGAGSDYVAFQDFAGVSSIDFSFAGGNYPYHSCYDNWEWMTSVLDPTFQYHEAVAQVLILLVLELADAPILPFNVSDYAAALRKYTDELGVWMESEQPGAKDNVDLAPLKDAVGKAAAYIDEFERQHEEWMELDEFGLPRQTDEAGAIWRRDRSARLSNFETHLLDLDEGGGVPGREWYKHVVFAPQAWSGYDPGYFPGIRDAVEAKNWDVARDQVQRVSRIIEKAALKLLH